MRPGLLTPAALLLAAGCSDNTVTSFNALPEAVITSHTSGDSELEGYLVEFRGTASDPDHDAAELIVTWYLGDEPICGPEAPLSDGNTSCQAVPALDDTDLSLQVGRIEDPDPGSDR